MFFQKSNPDYLTLLYIHFSSRAGDSWGSLAGG